MVFKEEIKAVEEEEKKSEMAEPPNLIKKAKSSFWEIRDRLAAKNAIADDLEFEDCKAKLNLKELHFGELMKKIM